MAPSWTLQISDSSKRFMTSQCTKQSRT